jgi:hypothetical protein
LTLLQLKKARCCYAPGFKPNLVKAQGLLAVGNGHAACGLKVV